MLFVKAFTSRTCRVVVVSGAAACAAGAASAQDSLTVVTQANPCAIYGSGFTPVQGTTTCARIGGRVRLESDLASGARAVSSPFPFAGEALGFAPEPDGANRAHLRAPSAAGSGAPRVR
ncbi:MAG: hypothetical protein JWN93_1797 [Hyphomicrobiales bacterium]|nr:hypothetical protein [Hyphomicrobiales bacterium]